MPAATMELERAASSPCPACENRQWCAGTWDTFQSHVVSACRCPPSHLPAPVDWFGDLPGVRISSDSFMEWIDEDNLKESVRGIFANPARTQDCQSPTEVSSSLFCSRLWALGKLELVNNMIDRLAAGRMLRPWAFVATTSHTELVYDLTLLALVPQSACFIGPDCLVGGGDPEEGRQLAVLPALYPKRKVHSIDCFFLHRKIPL